MNMDKTIAAIEQGFQNPDTVIKRIAIPDDKMPDYQLRRKEKGVAEHWVWMLSVGERNHQPTAWFIDHKLSLVLKKALAWRGVQAAPRGKSAQANGQHAAAHK